MSHRGHKGSCFRGARRTLARKLRQGVVQRHRSLAEIAELTGFVRHFQAALRMPLDVLEYGLRQHMSRQSAPAINSG